MLKWLRADGRDCVINLDRVDAVLDMGRWRVYARCDDRFFTLAEGVTFESEGWSPEWPDWIGARFVRDRNIPVYLQKSRVEGFKVENGEVIAILAGHEFAVQEPDGRQLREEFFGT